MTEHPRYLGRTVEWGHWGIMFMDVQPDRALNYGVERAYLPFGVGARGPIDAGPIRATYNAMCRDWIADGVLPVKAAFRVYVFPSHRSALRDGDFIDARVKPGQEV